MIEFYNFTKKQHINYDSLKTFLRSIYPNYYPQSYTTTLHEINKKEERLCHNRSNDENKNFESQIQEENFSMNERIRNLRDKIRKKEMRLQLNQLNTRPSTAEMFTSQK